MSRWLSKRWKAIVLLAIFFALWRAYLAGLRGDQIPITDLYADGSIYWSLITAGFVAAHFTHSIQPAARRVMALIGTFIVVSIFAIVVTLHLPGHGVGGIVGLLSAIGNGLFYFPNRAPRSDTTGERQNEVSHRKRTSRHSSH